MSSGLVMESSELIQSTTGRKPNRILQSLWLIARFCLGVVLLLSIGFGTLQLYRRLRPAMGSESELLLHAVQKRTLEDTVIERGTIESQNTVYGKCELPGNESSIVFIVPEGTVVCKGDIIVKLESSKIDQQIALKKIALNEVRANSRKPFKTSSQKRTRGTVKS